MKMIALLMMLFSSVALGASAPLGYPTATGIRLFKQNLDLNGQVSMLSGSVDPTSTATSAPIGSIYMNTTSGQLYRKLDAGSTTNWALATTGAISQAQVVGTISISGCSATWSTSSTTFADFAASSGCTLTVTGAASVPATQIPAIKFASLGAGEYLIAAEGYLTATQGNASYYQFWDGTNTAREQSANFNSGTGAYGQSGISQSINYSTAQSNVTLSMRGKVSGGSITINNTTPFVIRVYYFPSQAQTVLTPALTPAYAGKQWLGATSGAIALGQSAAASNTRTVISFSQLGTYTTLGSAQNDASTNAQVTATLPAGEYETEFSGFMRASTAASGTTTYCVFDLWDGTNVLGSAYFGSPAQAATSIQDMSHLRGYFKLTGTTTKTIQLRGAKTAGDSSNASYCQVYADTSGAQTGSTLMLTIAPRTQTVPMPVIANSVITSSAGVQRVESVAFGGAAEGTNDCTTSPCTIYRQTGSWVSSVVRSAAGVYAINFATPFSAPPTCTCGSNRIGFNATACGPFSPTTTSINLASFDANGGVNRDATVQVICQGPK